MRIVVVEPGPNFSVQDVAKGWTKAFERTQNQVRTFDTSAVLTATSKMFPELDGPELQGAACRTGADVLKARCYEFQPDLVVIISAFYIPPETWAVIRARGSKIAAVLTESPYEDDKQVHIAAHADICVVNDPTNLDQFRAHNPNSHYLPHAYDPTVHYRQTVSDDYRSDFAFVGTGFPSRVQFFEQIDWSGIDAAFAGHWSGLDDDSPLRKFLAHDIEACCPNDETVRLYSGTKASANLYRREANIPELAAGWAMGPREVELAATGTFFLTEERGENCEVLPMVPTFTEPADFASQLRWWLDHDKARRDVAEAAQRAVAGRTFDAHAAWLLNHL